MTKSSSATITELIAQFKENTKNRHNALYSQFLTTEQAEKLKGQFDLSQLLSLTTTYYDLTGEVRYPSWQFEKAVLPYMIEIITIMENYRYKWYLHDFFTQEHELLKMTPLQALRQNKYQQVLEAAKASNDDW